MRFGERIYTLLRISILSYQDYKNIISSLWGDFIFWVKSPLTNVLLGLDAVAVPFVVIVTAESQVERCVINLLFQKYDPYWVETTHAYGTTIL